MEAVLLHTESAGPGGNLQRSCKGIMKFDVVGSPVSELYGNSATLGEG